MAKPPAFPTSVVGSLPRPEFVKDLIADDAAAVAGALRRLMDAAVRSVVALQETPASTSSPTASGGASPTSA